MSVAVGDKSFPNHDARLESEREARFQQYYRSLNLDHSTELPAIASHKDGRQEQIMFRIEC